MALTAKDKVGSKIRCLDLSLMIKDDPVILQKLVNLEKVTIPENPTIIPCGRGNPEELIFNRRIAVDFIGELLKSNRKCKFSDYSDFKKQTEDWWLVHTNGANTPNWDIACIAEINKRKGLILVEAKAHKAELSREVKTYDHSNPHSLENHERIIMRIQEAGKELSTYSKLGFNLSDKSPYQLSNRFAWSWFLAMHGIPVVLVYLGFLNAKEMNGKQFDSHEDVVQSIQAYCRGKNYHSTVFVPDQAWKQEPLFDDGYVTMYSVIRSMELRIGQSSVVSINGRSY